MISPLTKALAAAVGVLLLALTLAGWALKHQIEEAAVAERRADEAESQMLEVARNLKVWNSALEAVDGKLGELRSSAWKQRQQLDKILGEVANENPEWARTRLPATYLAGLCAAGLVSEAARAELCAAASAPSR